MLYEASPYTSILKSIFGYFYSVVTFIMEVLAIIPARGGSKGIPRKNLCQVAGKTLVEHSVQHALDSKLVSRVVVSTEDPEIKEVAVAAGAEAPFDRPQELAEDYVLDWPVFVHCLEHLKASESYSPDLILHLRPTAPYRKPEWIDEAINLLANDETADSVRSVSLVDMHPYRMFSVDDAGVLKSIMLHEHPEPYLLRRQELPAIYYYNCVIDVTRPSTIFDQRSTTGAKMLAYIMNPADVIDVDTPRDLEVAELFFAGKIQ